jgi:hypothetical protein
MERTSAASPAASLASSEATVADPAERAILKSVLFAALFDYPLTLAELRHTLIESAQTPTQILTRYARSEILQASIEYRDGFFLPRGRPELIDIRREREQYSRLFLRRHQRFLQIACAMPFVRLVALSGSAAHLNVDEAGDLDLLVVTRGEHAWSVTVALVLLAKAMGCRRSVCVNFVMADSRLRVEQEDLFTASQLLHLKPVTGHEVHEALLAANAFVYAVYPNATLRRPPMRSLRTHLFDGVKRAAEVVFGGPAFLAEACCRYSYRRYLLSRAAGWESPEQVQLDRDRLKLHTRSHRADVMDRFTHAANSRLQGYSAPP